MFLDNDPHTYGRKTENGQMKLLGTNMFDTSFETPIINSFDNFHYLISFYTSTT